MRQPLRLVPPLVLALAVAAGCHAPAVTTPPAGVQQVATARVHVDLAALFGRHVLGLGFAETAAIATARLTASGPGVATQSVDAAWSATGTPPSLALRVAAGPNRLFTLEGLDASGRRIAVMRTLASLTAGADVALTINANTDAAGRVLEDLLTGPQAGDQADTAGIAASLAATDLTADLQAFVQRVTAYTAANNTFGGIDPHYFRDRELADRLRAGGRAILAAAPDAAMLTTGGAALTVVVTDGGAPASGVTVTVYDHGSGAPASIAAGQYTFPKVAPGRWTVKAKLGAKEAWSTITVRDTETGLNLALALAVPPAPPFVPPALPALAGGPVTPAGTAPYVYTLAGGTATNVVLDAYKAGSFLAGEAMGKLAVDAAGTLYFQLHDMIFKTGSGGTVQRLAASSTAQSGSPVTGSALKGFDVAPDGTVYLLDDTGKLYRIAPGGTPAFVTTVPNATGVALAPNGKLYVRQTNAITPFDPATGLADPAFRVTGSGPIAADAASMLYVMGSSGLWKVSPAGLATAFSGADGGDVDGAPGVALFNQPGAFAVAGQDLIVPDTGNNHLRKVHLADGVVSTLGGQPEGLVDGPLAAARFFAPVGVAYDAPRQLLYVADLGNYRIRKVDLAAGQVSTAWAFHDPLHVEGTGAGSRFGVLGAVVPVGTTAYVLDTTARVIDAVDPTGVTTRWGGNGEAGVASGLPLAASIGDTKTMVRDASGIGFLLGSTLLRKYDSATNTIAILPVSPLPSLLASQAVGPTFGYVASPAGLYTLDPAGNQTPVAAGTVPTAARAMAADGLGNVYLATQTTLWVRPPGGTFARVPGSFGNVTALAVDDTDRHVFFSDGLVIKEYDPTSNAVSTLAGTGSSADVDGPAASAAFATFPTSMAAAGGKVYVTELDRLRVIQR
jgi:hypothetical protein